MQRRGMLACTARPDGMIARIQSLETNHHPAAARETSPRCRPPPAPAAASRDEIKADHQTSLRFVRAAHSCHACRLPSRPAGFYCSNTVVELIYPAHTSYCQPDTRPIRPHYSLLRFTARSPLAPSTLCHVLLLVGFLFEFSWVVCVSYDAISVDAAWLGGSGLPAAATDVHAGSFWHLAKVPPLRALKLDILFHFTSLLSFSVFFAGHWSISSSFISSLYHLISSCSSSVRYAAFRGSVELCHCALRMRLHCARTCVVAPLSG